MLARAIICVESILLGDTATLQIKVYEAEVAEKKEPERPSKKRLLSKTPYKSPAKEEFRGYQTNFKNRVLFQLGVTDFVVGWYVTKVMKKKNNIFEKEYAI